MAGWAGSSRQHPHTLTVLLRVLLPGSFGHVASQVVLLHAPGADHHMFAVWRLRLPPPPTPLVCDCVAALALTALCPIGWG